MRYLPFVALLALTIYALVDCVLNDDPHMPVDLPKGVWVILIVLFPAIGPIAWLVVSRADRFSRSQQSGSPSTPRPTPSAYRPPVRPGRPSQPRPRSRPVAPDDDPDFLASLNPPSAPTGDDGADRTDEKDTPPRGRSGSDGSGDDEGRDSGPASSAGPNLHS